MCSDGLTKELGPERINAILAASDPGDAAQALADAACDAGGRDNVTTLVIDFLASGG
ncbi:hypothetical protein [Thiorhodococcus minor]|uniref:Serine/threonine-protein phosphatase n=1 Tax=Thiorhodococcus minor TaxID=57489 RepID=A0A6M0JSC0_9GAMM|nr:hypothetical protein [Thiorhodococcus minor]NEV60416.1 hypothetical protein [Thiorhodococcus minor]